MSITGPVVVRGENMAFGDIVRHRGGGRKGKNFGFFDRERGVCLNASMSVYTSERLNPRHKHDFDQLRYYVRGGENYTKQIFGPGDCVYFPEGVPYGPTFTAEGSDENVRLGMQFQGPSRRPFFQRVEVQKGDQELLALGGKFEKGLFIWPDGRKQDSAEAIREHLGGVKLEYPKPRYDEYVVMHSEQYVWQALERVPGVLVKHLGYFNECGPNVKMIQVDAGASTPAGTAPCQQVRYVVEGEVTFQGESYSAISCMYFPAHVPYPATSSAQGAKLLVVQLGSHDGHPPPWCLI
ncbi:MAG: hypothetical protein ACREQW_14860 [Candidatus Binatia bacterium]